MKIPIFQGRARGEGTIKLYIPAQREGQTRKTRKAEGPTNTELSLRLEKTFSSSSMWCWIDGNWHSYKAKAMGQESGAECLLIPGNIPLF